jgi:hypothetical protein
MISTLLTLFRIILRLKNNLPEGEQTACDAHVRRAAEQMLKFELTYKLSVAK